MVNAMIEAYINRVDLLIFDFVKGSFLSLNPIIEILWHGFFILFIAIYGYKTIITGKFSSSQLIVSCLKIIVLLILATQWDNFFLFIYTMSTDFPSDVSGQIMKGSLFALDNQAPLDTTSANIALSQFFDRAMKATENLLEGANFLQLPLYMYALIIWGATLAFAGYATALIILAKLGIAVLLSVGPLFIILYTFSNTKGLLENWLRALFNYALLPIFLYAVLALLLALIEAPLQYMENNIAPESEILSSIAPFVISACLSVILLLQVHKITSSIARGISLNSFFKSSDFI